MAAPGIFVGKGEAEVFLLPKYGNRHGLIAGATGTGKTVSLQVLAEGFSKLGVSVFLADVKGDLSGMCVPGGGKQVFEDRAKQIGMADYSHAGFPVTFWDLLGENGHPIRATISEMGPLLLARLLDLNDVQEGVLNVAFKVADDNGLLLLDLKDLRAMIAFVGENSKELTLNYGQVSTQSVGAIQRSLLTLEQQGADRFFGEPALDLNDLMRTDVKGQGMINILTSDKLIHNPRAYATMLLWVLSELFSELPEVGDSEKPKLVFFFDEAHLLFSDAPSALLQKIEQVVRLIRSKGVGVYFVTQNPIDIPDTVLGQLGNRVQHALRAFTPRDEKAVRIAADTFRVNSKFSTAEAITQLAVGEALCSMLEAGGIPAVVDRTFIRPPESRVGPATVEERAAALRSDGVGGKYDKAIDRESAFEVLRARTEQHTKQVEADEPDILPGPSAREKRQPAPERRPPARRSDSVIESVTKSFGRSIAGQIGRSLTRTILGGLFKKR